MHGDPLHVIASIAGVACLWIVLLDAFQTIILPRRASGRFRLTRIFYMVHLESLGIPDRCASHNTAQARIGIQLLRPPVADFSAGGVGGSHGGGFCAHLLSPWAVRFNDVAQPAGFPLRPLCERNHDLYAGPGRCYAAKRRTARAWSFWNRGRGWDFWPWSWAIFPCSTAHSRVAKSAFRCWMRGPDRRRRLRN